MIPYGNHSARSVALPAKLTSHSPKTRRSAVKARLTIRYADHSAAGIAPVAVPDVMAFGRPSRDSEPFVMRRHALESRANRGMRTYVTSSDDARGAMCMRYDLTPRRVASSMARGTRAARRPRAASTAGGRQSQGWGSGEGRRRMRCSAGAVAEVRTLKATEGAKGPAMLTGTRVTARAWTVAPLPLP